MKHLHQFLQQLILSSVVVALVSGCAANPSKSLPSDQVSIEFSGLFIRPFDLKPVTWLTVKVTNKSEKTFADRFTRVVDVFNNTNLYGGKDGFKGSGFTSDPLVSWPLDVKTLEPGSSGYLSFNVGDPLGTPEGSIIRIFLGLISTDGFIAKSNLVIDVTNVEPVNQM